MSDNIKVNDTVYVKKEYMTGVYFPLGHHIKYKLNGNSAKVLGNPHYDILKDGIYIGIKMLYDGHLYTLPLDAVSKNIEDKIPSTASDCCGFVSNAFNVDENILNHTAFVPKRIIYNDPATIVFWEDGTKTVVKRAPKEKFNTYNAFCAALAKKIYGNNSRVRKLVNSGEDYSIKVEIKNPKFVRDENGRWVSTSKAKKKAKKK